MLVGKLQADTERWDETVANATLPARPARLNRVNRGRMLSAMAAAACEHGASNVTVAHVVQRACVSRRTFYEEFQNVEDCLWACLQEALATARERVIAAPCPTHRWPVRIRAGLGALLELFDEQPQLARLLVVESLAAGRRALELRFRAIEELAEAVEAGQANAGSDNAGVHVNDLTADYVVGAALSVLHGHICASDGRPLSALANSLMGMIVLPYLGAAAAQRELERPAAVAAERAGQRSPVREEPFKDLGIRLTRRTVCVLQAISKRPGMSNRGVAALAGVADTGQMSKLLARLERHGLVLNGARIAGASNAWSLTEKGREIVAAGARRERSGQAGSRGGR